MEAFDATHASIHAAAGAAAQKQQQQHPPAQQRQDLPLSAVAAALARAPPLAALARQHPCRQRQPQQQPQPHQGLGASPVEQSQCYGFRRSARLAQRDRPSAGSAANQPASGAGQADQHTDMLNIVVRDMSGNEVHFKVKEHTHMEHVMQAYCDKKGIDDTIVRFLFNGLRVMPYYTPSALRMEDGGWRAM
jgi:small ubiquitin-related modifier